MCGDLLVRGATERCPGREDGRRVLTWIGIVAARRWGLGRRNFKES